MKNYSYCLLFLAGFGGIPAQAVSSSREVPFTFQSVLEGEKQGPVASGADRLLPLHKMLARSRQEQDKYRAYLIVSNRANISDPVAADFSYVSDIASSDYHPVGTETRESAVNAFERDWIIKNVPATLMDTFLGSMGFASAAFDGADGTMFKREGAYVASPQIRTKTTFWRDFKNFKNSPDKAGKATVYGINAGFRGLLAAYTMGLSVPVMVLAKEGSGALALREYKAGILIGELKQDSFSLTEGSRYYSALNPENNLERELKTSDQITVIELGVISGEVKNRVERRRQTSPEWQLFDRTIVRHFWEVSRYTSTFNLVFETLAAKLQLTPTESGRILEKLTVKKLLVSDPSIHHQNSKYFNQVFHAASENSHEFRMKHIDNYTALARTEEHIAWICGAGSSPTDCSRTLMVMGKVAPDLVKIQNPRIAVEDLRACLSALLKIMAELKKSVLVLHDDYRQYVSEWKGAINGESLHKTALLNPLLFQITRAVGNDSLTKHLSELLKNPSLSPRFMQPNSYAKALLKGAKETGANYYQISKGQRYAGKFFGQIDYKVGEEKVFTDLNAGFRDSTYLKINWIHDKLMN